MQNVLEKFASFIEIKANESITFTFLYFSEYNCDATTNYCGKLSPGWRVEIINCISSKPNSNKFTEIAASEKNAKKMIIYTLIVYIVCRLPEMIVYFWLFSAFYSDGKFTYMIGPLLINCIQYLYMLSYITKFFFLCKFNRTFNVAFKNILK